MAELYELEAFLKTITYKPGWRFSLIVPDLPKDPVLLEIVAKVPNAYDPKKLIEIVNKRYILYDLYPFDTYDWHDEFADFIYRVVVDLEVHEVKEFFKVAGKHHRDPHPELRKADA